MGKSKKKSPKIKVQLPGCGFGCGCMSQIVFAILAFLFLVFLVYNWAQVWQFVTTGVW